MGKKKTKKLEVAALPVEPTKVIKKPVFKSRFSGLVKVDAGQSVPDATVRVIEGKQYLEFDGLKGVYFSAEIFAE